jgi:uncharacterized protein (TIGR02145 family)
MKRSLVCIIIIILVALALWFYFANRISNLESQLAEVTAERDAAIELAVAEALELSKSRGVAKEPPVKTKIVYVEKEAPPKKAMPAKNTFTDERDGQQYKYIEVDNMVWMADNLNFQTEGSWCYEGNSENCKNWGRLYSWDAAMKACPDGWHLPDNEEWNKLIWAYGGNDVAGKALKKGGNSDFDALMAGYRDKQNFYGKVDTSAYFWTATEENPKYAQFKGIYKDYSNIGPYTYTKADGFSVRCVKDN